MVENSTNIYQPYILKIPMLNTEVLIRHVEILDNKTPEFKHVHNSLEIYYPIEGNLKIDVSDSQINIPAGQLLLLAPGTWHGTVYEPDVKRKYFIMIFDIIESISTCDDNIWSELEISELQKVLTNVKTNQYYIIDDKYNCHTIIDQINNELIIRSFGWQSILRSLYLKFIILTFRNLMPTSEHSKSRVEFPSNVNLAIEITKYMHKNYNSNITLRDVANAMYVSPRHINRVFEACFGTTFSRTLSIFRLNYAKDYLYNTNYSVEKIANLVGFSASRTLLRLFREVEGMTTTQYRDNIRKSHQ
ncbi:helix-turn-helix domain-containing protein [Alkalibaculum sp. M08DMB]|uniref:Helix-turn-helix domain-containing protein n=1 Tax=Alkalibaculum sporogenes TaxID=2655001 RepID=A0A6A7K501_9FIRM|nr:AraC family transcriptional regulator [Alkalibaculum sporogenes]MPW24536.1 helix-turn-helix domain-containing protein [Alkalibaculum sporogenes]